MRIEHDIPLGPLTTFKIGGNARLYTRVSTLDDLKAAVGYAHALDIPIFILGGGSNVLISDKGFSGLVIQPVFTGISCDSIVDRGECVAHAGDIWDDVVKASVQYGLSGLENLSLIPGTLGGAVVQNIGAYGTELERVFVWADVFDMRTGEIIRLHKIDCDFGYRSSIFKTPEGRNYIVIKAAFKLIKNIPPDISYKDLQIYFTEQKNSHPGIQGVRDAVIAIRTEKLPDLSRLGSAGSFFKNPVIEKVHADQLSKKYPNMPVFPISDEMVKVSAAWIIDNICKLRGYREGDAGISPVQALVLVNYGKATASDISSLAKKIIEAVYSATSIRLEPEVESV